MVGITTKEYITKVDNLEIWAAKYTFKSWIVYDRPEIDTRTGKIYYIGDLCFALISYVDKEGKYHLVDETKYFVKV